MPSQKEHDLAKEYFYYHFGENVGFTHNVLTTFLPVTFPLKAAKLVSTET